MSPARQDRVATLAPLLSVLLFLAAIVAAFWYLRNEEVEREIESVRRDAELVQQQIRLRLIENQEQFVRVAREVMQRSGDHSHFDTQAEALLRTRPEIIGISWLDASQRTEARMISPDLAGALPHLALAGPNQPLPEPARRAFHEARDLRLPTYSRPFTHDERIGVVQLHVPLIDHGAFVGTLMVEYSIEALLRYFVPVDVQQRHVISLLDASDTVLASTMASQPGRTRGKLIYDVSFGTVGQGLTLRGEGYRTSFGLIGNTLFWMVLALSVLTVWMLLGTWRHMRRRLQIQGALVQETNFRRAMENSMLTGMRAMDQDGRITYVNPAFCAMTGFSEAELIGRMPPYPTWPPDRVEENSRLLVQELAGRSPAGGIEVRVLRKDGTQFDARMYVSPLIDSRGQQTGWMTSMTNITEAKRIRDQLTASHERFTTVLEGLDAAVSVLAVQNSELLFANRSYRLWFGGDAHWHALLAGMHAADGASEGEGADDVDGLGGLPTAELTDASADTREVYVDTLEKWFDVRARYLQWTDGRLAQMLIATDITARRRIEELAAQQAERAQVTSRLVTMGEMASSVAHELNQPLAAISNYCNGIISRHKAGKLSDEDLLSALEKTSRQAHRAGQIIHRIRAFVKRSEPQRQEARATDIVEDAVELAGIELRRRNITLHTYVAQRLPVLQVDPILIEQVLLNLIKNAAEAIDGAALPPKRRYIELRVVPRHTPELGGVIEFSVSDNGPGLKEEVINRLYEAFFSTKTEGLGIGLSLCRSIIESHQGRIKAENLYNSGLVTGCRFTVLLPVQASISAALTAASATPVPAPLTAPQATVDSSHTSTESS
ncbi:PAS domain S-box protein [Leptothrix discophora]|uniref:histidine kinase n=1 Tax=Leptothrix discophora TaxID=89 RepID=A0ABT9G5Y4_LEPDI|nr:PAS domain S-box protein [Leptothrix discophora]MDP4301593.1 PAS domain S-box protein [Leptothrix discophora]